MLNTNRCHFHSTSFVDHLLKVCKFSVLRLMHAMLLRELVLQRISFCVQIKTHSLEDKFSKLKTCLPLLMQVLAQVLKILQNFVPGLHGNVIFCSSTHIVSTIRFSLFTIAIKTATTMVIDACSKINKHMVLPQNTLGKLPCFRFKCTQQSTFENNDSSNYFYMMICMKNYS